MAESLHPTFSETSVGQYFEAKDGSLWRHVALKPQITLEKVGSSERLSGRAEDSILEGFTPLPPGEDWVVREAASQSKEET